MYLNQFESFKAARLNQILHTLAEVHGIKFKVDYESPSLKRTLVDLKCSYENERKRIIQESKFNSYQTNPAYTSCILILEAVKIMLTEISPKRRKRKKIRESQTIYETLKHVQNYEKDNKRVEVWQETSTGQYTIKMFENNVHLAKLDAVADSQQEANEVVQDRLSRVVNDNNSGSRGYSSTLSKWENLATKMKDYKSNNTKLQNDFQRVGQELLDKGSPHELTSTDQHVVKMAMKFLKTNESSDSDVTIMQANNAHHTDKPGMHNVHETSPGTDLTENKGRHMSEDKQNILENAMNQQPDYEYQASMARSELYRNAKYAMSMIKQIDPYGEIQPWIAANLTKAANYLDKIFHYLDYYKKFEPEKLPEGMDGDMELGETSGSVARENCMLIVEYSIKLFNMIQPGEKLEGWVAMKLTTASEGISSCKHYLDYVQFETHGLDSHFDEGRAQMKKKMTEAQLLEAEQTEDLQKAKSILTAQEMTDAVQKIAETTAKLSVEDLMPLIDSLRVHFGADAANGFNQVVKAALDELLAVASKTKESIDSAISSIQTGQVPGVASDLEKAQPTGEPELPGEEPTGKEQAPPAAPEEPLGRAKKEVSEAKKAKEPGAVATAQVKKMGPSYWTGKHLTKKGIKKRDEIIASIEKKLEETIVREKAPPGKEAEHWIKSNKARFMKKYGPKKGMAYLYGRAWKQFGESNNTFEETKSIVANKTKMLENLQQQLKVHKKKFAESVQAGVVKDPLAVGYGLEGQAIIDKMSIVQKEIDEASSVLVYEMKKGINSLLEQIKINQKAETLASLKNITPYGVIYTRNGKLAKKMFESQSTRDYWVDVNSKSIDNVKLIEPDTFDKAIEVMIKGS
jgi:hypothetical protein